MDSLTTGTARPHRTLIFGSAMHVWSDLFFALYVPLLPFIAADLELSYKQVGLLRSVYGLSSAVLQVPAGFLAEITGEFWLLVLGNAWVAAGVVGMAFAPGFLILLAVSFGGGLGGGMQHPLASSMVSRAYDERGRSTAVGTVNFSGDLGKMAAPAFAGLMAVHFGWRTAMWVIGAAGLFFMLLTVLARRSVDTGRPVTQSTDVDAPDTGGSQKSGFIALSWIGFLDSATRGAALVFLPFVMEAKGMGLGQVSGMLVVLFAGGAAGKFVCGWLADRYGSVMLIWGTKGVTALMLLAAVFGPVWSMAPLMLVLGLGLNGTSSVLYGAVADLVPARRRARLYGFFYTTNEGGTLIAPLVYGVIADAFGLDTTMVVMCAATAAILPASLTLRRFLPRGW